MRLILALLILIPSICEANTRDSLIGWWKLDEAATGNAIDSSWNGSVGTSTGTTVNNNCPRSNCRNFEANSFISMGDLSLYEFASGASFSISAWIFPTSNGSVCGVVTKGYATVGEDNRPWYLIRFGNGGTANVDFFLRTSAGANFTTSGITTSLNKWHHVVGIYDGVAGSVVMFVDGVKGTAVTSVTAQTYGTNTSSFVIGRHNAVSFTGNIDDVRMYNRVLTDKEVADLYNPGILVRGTATTIKGVGTTFNY